MTSLVGCELGYIFEASTALSVKPAAPTTAITSNTNTILETVFKNKRIHYTTLFLLATIPCYLAYGSRDNGEFKNESTCGVLL